MAASSGAERAAHTIQDLLANPYVKKVVQDQAIRDNARVAYDSAREAIDRVKGSDSPLSAIFDDRKLQAELAAAGKSLAEARGRLVEQGRRKRHWGRRVLLVVVGAGAALALSERLRNKALDLLFGAEEEFDYVSTTAPPAAEPAAAAAEPAAPDAAGPEAAEGPVGA
ncbi:MAG: hypothetical protein LT070_04870 [Solirubrobacteraceae bacterium]|nr:hypothetical protein [Solirubrobacteraceae bacterium]